jgi:hypothetical protein
MLASLEMPMATKRSPFIVNLESHEPDEGLLHQLERAGLTVDRAYGLVKLDPQGKQRVARVMATEEQLEGLQEQLRATFYPDLAAFTTDSNEEG